MKIAFLVILACLITISWGFSESSENENDLTFPRKNLGNVVAERLLESFYGGKSFVSSHYKILSELDDVWEGMESKHVYTGKLPPAPKTLKELNEEPTQKPLQNSKAELNEKLAQEPLQNSKAELNEEPTQKPLQNSKAELNEEPAQGPLQNSKAELNEKPAQEPLQNSKDISKTTETEWISHETAVTIASTFLTISLIFFAGMAVFVCTRTRKHDTDEGRRRAEDGTAPRRQRYSYRYRSNGDTVTEIEMLTKTVQAIQAEELRRAEAGVAPRKTQAPTSKRCCCRCQPTEGTTTEIETLTTVPADKARVHRRAETGTVPRKAQVPSPKQYSYRYRPIEGTITEIETLDNSGGHRRAETIKVPRKAQAPSPKRYSYRYRPIEGTMTEIETLDNFGGHRRAETRKVPKQPDAPSTKRVQAGKNGKLRHVTWAPLPLPNKPKARKSKRYLHRYRPSEDTIFELEELSLENEQNNNSVTLAKDTARIGFHIVQADVHA